MDIRRLGVGDDEAVVAAEHLFDHPVKAEAVARFLTDDDSAAARATYRNAGGREASRSLMLDWEFQFPA